MSASGTESSKFVVYSFSGSKEKFQEWKVKTLSLSRVHKVHRYLTQKLVIPTEQEAENKGESSSEYKAYEGNVKAYDLLVRSCTGIPLGLIESVESGNAFEAWEKLISKYETTKEDVQSLEERWNGCKLDGLTQDPLEWFLHLDRINRLLESIDKKYKKDEVQIAGHLLNNVGKDYSSVVTGLEASGKTKDVEAIQDAFKRHWKKYKSTGSKGGLGEAYALEGKKFTGICNYCKKPGHKWADCFKRKADMKKKGEGGKKKEDGSQSQSSKKCWVCGGDHLKKDCPKRNNGSKNNELNTIFEDSMYCCEVQDGVSYKDVLVGEINMCIPTNEPTIDVLIEDIEADPSDATTVDETTVNERENLNNERENLNDEASNMEYDEEGNMPATDESTETNSDARARLTAILRGVLARRNEPNPSEMMDIGNGYFHIDIEYESKDESYFSINSLTTGTDTNDSASNEDDIFYVKLVESDDVPVDGLEVELDLGMMEEHEEVNMNEEKDAVESNVVPGKFVMNESGRIRRKLIPRLSTCEACGTLGLYLDDCIKCGEKHETLDAKPTDDELSSEGITLGRCHLCKEVGMFACKCACGGFVLLRF